MPSRKEAVDSIKLETNGVLQKLQQVQFAILEYWYPEQNKYLRRICKFG